MKKLLFLLPILGCGPYFIDLTAGIGADQKISKQLNVDQKQTTVQTNVGIATWDDIIKILPFFAAATPVPTPTPIVKSITLNLVDPTPTPGYVIQEYYKDHPPIPRPTRTPKPTPKPKPTPYKDCCANAPYEMLSATPTPGFGY